MQTGRVVTSPTRPVRLGIAAAYAAALALWIANGFGVPPPQQDLDAVASLVVLLALGVLTGGLAPAAALAAIPLAALLLLPLEVAIDAEVYTVSTPPSGGTLEFTPLGALLVATPGVLVAIAVGHLLHTVTVRVRRRRHDVSGPRTPKGDAKGQR